MNTSSELPPKQYYLTASRPETVPDGYVRESIAGSGDESSGEWHVVRDDGYASVPVVARGENAGTGGERVGHVVGTILDVRDRCDDGVLPLPTGDKTALAASFEDALADLAGRYVAVLDADEQWLYTDPAGALPAVYEPEERVVGTAPAVLPGVDTRSRFRAGLFDRLNLDDEHLWLPGEITYFSGVRRLLPNHRLNLQTWETARYWPSDREEVSASADPRAVAESIGTALRRVFETVVGAYDDPIMSLTGGRDTRTLLAGARPWLADGEISTFTWDLGERYDVDLDIARRLSSDHGLDWTSVPVVTASERERAQWREHTGYTVGGKIMRIHPTLGTLDGDVQINGFGGEIGRAYFWSPSDERDATFGTRELLDRLHRPVDPVLEDAVADWYDGVAEFDAFTQLDLMYQELRLGCWAGPHHPGMAQYRDFVGPLYYRPIVREMHRLPPEVRREDELSDLVVGQFWPELGEYPYTAYGDWRDYVRHVKQFRRKVDIAVSRPDYARSYFVRQFRRKLSDATRS